jgi:hypothetical protein
VIQPLFASPSVTPSDVGPNVALQAVLAGQKLPFTMKAQDLSAEWHVVRLDLPVQTALQRMQTGLPENADGNRVYYTRFQTLSIAGATYLIAYTAAPQTGPNARRDAPRFDEAGVPIPPRNLRPNSVLRLSLLNLRSVSAMNDLHPFNSEQDVEGADPQSRSREANLRNLSQIGMALLQYAQDYDETLPPMQSATSTEQLRRLERAPMQETTVQQSLLPYISSLDIFLHPATGQLYRSNPALSRKKLRHIITPTATVAFYEAAPDAEGKRAVLFVNGRVQQVTATEWKQFRQASQIAP